MQFSALQRLSRWQNRDSLRINASTEWQTNFFYQLQILTASGMTLAHSLAQLEQQEHGKTQQLTQFLHQQITNGNLLAKSLYESGAFNHSICRLIDAGERANLLPLTLKLCHQHLSERTQNQQALRKILTYPVILLVVCGTSLTAATIMLFPQLKVLMTSQSEIPLTTQLIFWLSNLSSIQYMSLLAGLLLLYFGYRKLKNSQQWHTYLLKSLFGTLIINYDLARYCQHLSNCLKVQMSFPEALKEAAMLLTNKAIQYHALKLYQAITQGQVINTAIANHPYFPPIISQLTANAYGHKLHSKAWAELAKHFFNQQEYQLNKIKPLIEPSLTLIIGLFVGLFVHAIILPLYNSM